VWVFTENFYLYPVLTYLPFICIIPYISLYIDIYSMHIHMNLSESKIKKRIQRKNIVLIVIARNKSNEDSRPNFYLKKVWVNLF
jgi:hypothetical protein